MIYLSFQEQGEALAKATGLKFVAQPYKLPKSNPYFEGYAISSNTPGLYGHFKGFPVFIDIASSIVSEIEQDTIREVTLVRKIIMGVPNPENKLLLLRREKLKSQVDKGLGKKELNFKHRKFDRHFWVETPFEEWGKNVFDEQLRKLFLRNIGLLNGRMELGDWDQNKQKIKTENTKKDLDDVLDYSLVVDDNLKPENTKVSDKASFDQISLRCHSVNIAVNGPMKVSWINRLIDLMFELGRRV